MLKNNRTVDKEYIKNLLKNDYYPKYHTLDLRNKWLKYLPDLCAVLTWNDVYEIWAIDASANAITQIDVDYSCLRNLQELNLSFNELSSINNLFKNTFLQRLYLHKNKITKISWLANLKELAELTLWYNEINKIEWLEALVNLTSLELQSNKIQNIEWLETLVNLIELKLDNNQISSLKWIENQKKIEYFSVGWNNLDQAIVDKINEKNQSYLEKKNENQASEIQIQQ